MTTSHSPTRRLARFFNTALVSVAALAATACLQPAEYDGEASDDSSCAADADCGADAYCGLDKLCHETGCVTDDDCPNDGVCGSDGQCGEGNFKPDDRKSCTETTSCVTGRTALSAKTPTIVLVVDQSGSMREDLGGSGSRWSVLRDALIDEQSGFLRRLDGQVRFGLALFTSDHGFKGGTCPMLTEVPIALGNYDAMADVYRAASPSGDTPTSETLKSVATRLAAFDADGPKAIVLATDGAPDTCDDSDAHDETSRALSVQAARDAFDLGIATYVISVGDEVGTEHLAQLANAGAGLPVDGAQQAPYFEANDQAQLVGALDRVIEGVRSCTFQLDGEVQPGNAASGSVTLDGQSLTYGDRDGWKLNSGSEVQLLGAACTRLMTGDHDVRASFPCTCQLDVR